MVLVRTSSEKRPEVVVATGEAAFFFASSSNLSLVDLFRSIQHFK